MANAPHEIIIIVKPDGKIESTVEGVAGPTCSELTKWLEELGVVEVDSQTPDYRKQNHQAITTRH